MVPLAAAFVGYIVFWNLSLQSNPVGFYQLSKIMVRPPASNPRSVYMLLWTATGM